MKNMRGISLLELLVSISMGLLILLGIAKVYLNSSQATRQHETQTELNETARLVLRIFRHELSAAGYVDLFAPDAAGQLLNPLDPNLQSLYGGTPSGGQLKTPLALVANNLAPLFGCDGAMASKPYTLATTLPLQPTCGVNDATRQTLQVAYQAAGSNSATGEGYDCNQQSLTTTGTPYVINQYFVKESPSDKNIFELYCAGSGNSIAQPLARGIQELVLRYQTSEFAAGGTQSSYRSAAEVSASSLGWAAVTAVEICLVSVTAGPAPLDMVRLQPDRPTCARDVSANPNGLGNYKPNPLRLAGDLRLWKRFSTVVAIRNSIYASPN